MWWSVEVTLSGETGTVTPEALERLETLLASAAATASGRPEEGPGRYGARLSVEADGPEAAIVNALATSRAAAAEAGLPAWPVVQVECMTEEELDRCLDRPAFPALVGVSEIARLLARDATPISRQRASALTSRPDFPRPVVRLAAGPVWTRDSVRNFVESWERKPGRPATNENLVNWTALADLPQGVLIAGLAALVAVGLILLLVRKDGVAARLIHPDATLPPTAPPEAAKVLDVTKKLAERNQMLQVPTEIAAAVARRRIAV